MSYIQKRKRAFGFALKGVQLFFKEAHAKLHLLFSILSILLGVFLDISHIEWGFILLCIGCVFCAEAFNSAIEKLVDLVSPNYNNQAGIIKDIAAGAVLLLCIFVATIGLIIFAPKIILLF